MQNSLVRKGLVIGIIVLFIGASGVSGVNRRINDLSNDITKVLNDVEDTVDVIEEHVISDESRQPLDGSFWWNPDWFYRKQITINHTMVDENLTNFPVLVSNISLDYIDHAQSDGDDFVFKSYDNSINYNHEIESYNEITGELIAWVNITTLSSTEDTIIWMYYGNSNVNNRCNIPGTWASGYIAVYHMNGTGDIDDMTGNGNIGQRRGDPTEVNGSFGKAQEFDRSGSNDWFNIGKPLHLDGLQDCTMSIWAKPANDMFFCTNNDGSDPNYFTFSHSNVMNFNRGELYSGSQFRIDGFTDVIDTWHHSSLVIDRGTDYFRLYVNGIEEDSLDISSCGSVDDYEDNWGIAAAKDSGGYSSGGQIDELRISKVVRSGEWINTSYNSMRYPELFISVGDEQLSNPFIVYVNDDYNDTIPGWGYDYFDSIQDGIDAVFEGGTVYVFNGFYNETFTMPWGVYVFITKNINLIGENKNETIINCPDAGLTGGQFGILVGHDTLVISNALISGFTLSGGDDSGSIGIYSHRNSNNITIEDCIIHNFADGIEIVNGSRDIIIRNCTTYNNTGRGGISLAWHDVSNFEISGCTSYSNTYGINIAVASNGLIYHNNLYSNGVNAYDAGTNNMWYNTSLQEGNYYDDYTGEDNNGDEIGDTSYNISGGSNQDLYPLMFSWGEMPPVADYTYSIQDLRVTFDPMNSYDRDGEIDYVVWQFGEPPVMQGPLGLVNHTYSSYGDYEVTLTAIDDDGIEGNITKTVLINDLIPPEIIDNTASIIGYTGDPFTFNATITDYGGIDTAWVTWWHEIIAMSVELDHMGGDYYEKTITIQDTLEPLKYYISANDISDNWQSSDTNYVTIYDNDDPEINDILADPEIQIIGRYVNISATITDNIEIQSVYIHVIYPDMFYEDIDITQNKIGDTYYLNQTYNQLGQHRYYLHVTDTSDNYMISEIYLFNIRENELPFAPVINGPTSGEPDIEYTYLFSAVDPESDDIYYSIYWGEGDIEEWFGPYASGEVIELNHTWTERGNYIIMARAMDVWGAIGEWGTLEIEMPVSQHSIQSQRLLFQRLIMRFGDQVKHSL